MVALRVTAQNQEYCPNLCPSRRLCVSPLLTTPNSNLWPGTAARRPGGDGVGHLWMEPTAACLGRDLHGSALASPEPGLAWNPGACGGLQTRGNPLPTGDPVYLKALPSCSLPPAAVPVLPAHPHFPFILNQYCIVTGHGTTESQGNEALFFHAPSFLPAIVCSCIYSFNKHSFSAHPAGPCPGTAVVSQATEQG